MRKTLWQRWKRLAHRAAEIQSLVVLTVLYWTVVVPIGWLAVRRQPSRVPPAWTVRPPAPPATLDSARRQS